VARRSDIRNTYKVGILCVIRTMVLTCPNCDSEIPEDTFGVEEAVENDITDEVVAHTYDPDGIGVSATEYFCDPDCFVEHHD